MRGQALHLTDGGQEVVLVQDLLAQGQLLLGALEVILQEQAVQEARDGVGELVRLLLDAAHEVLHGPPPPLVDDHRGCQVAQQVLRLRLDGVQVSVPPRQRSASGPA